MELASFNPLLKRIVELSVSITRGPGSIQVSSLEGADQPTPGEAQQREQTSTISINASDIVGDDSSGEEYWEEDDPEMEAFASQLLCEAERQAYATESRVSNLFDCLVKIRELFSQEERDNQELLANQLLLPDQEGSIEEIYALSFNLFEATKGLSCQDDLIQMYLIVSSNIEGWYDVSERLCKQATHRGLLLQDINHLIYFANQPAGSSEILEPAIETQLSIINNCARNCALPEYYYAGFNWAKLITQLLNAYTGINFTCKLLANTLAVCFQREQYQAVLDLTVDDLSMLKVALIESSISSSMVGKVCDYQYSALELLTALQSFWNRPRNRRGLTDPSVLTAVCRLVEQGGDKEKLAALRLLWSLLDDEELKKCFRLQHKGVLDLIKLETSGKSELSIWYQGVLALVQDHTIGGETDWLLATVRCCYDAEQYTRCVELCDKVSGVTELQLYQGKSLYQIYWRKRRLMHELKHDKAAKQQFHKQHHACYEVAREAMKILGRAKDSGFIEADTVSQKMLDTVMMDYILETNRLKETKRCFLCLQRQQYEKVAAAAAATGSVEDKGEVQQKAGGIKRSHLIPHGVIKRLAKVDSSIQPTNPKPVVFGVSGTKLDSERTPATSTVHMLCGSCEKMINANGEYPFISFFEKLIDPTLVDSRQELKYGKELYYFCLSLIFRTLCPSQEEYINTDEVYQLLLHCRAYLLEGGSSKADNLPEVLLFINPFAGSEDDKYKGFVEQSSVSYTAKFALDCKREELDSFNSVYANFFLVKMGIVIVVVIFRPLQRYKIHDNCLVCPEGGVYIVPSANERAGIVPDGVKTALQLLFDVYASDLDKFNRSKSTDPPAAVS